MNLMNFSGYYKRSTFFICVISFSFSKLFTLQAQNIYRDTLLFSHPVYKSTFRNAFSNSDSSYYLQPYINSSYSFGNESNSNQNSFGFAGFANKNRLSASILYNLNLSNYPFQVNNFVDSTGILNSVGRVSESDKEYKFFQQYELNLSWQVNRYLTLSTGNGRMFVGDGQRSLFLSENAPSFPYASFEINGWKIKYLYSLNFLRDIESVDDFSIQKKYAATHLLSFQATKWLNLYSFEAIIWDHADSLGYRGIEVNYLNPVTFFRPVEYAVGSPDNALLGLGGNVILMKSLKLYGQLILDELNFEYFTNEKGWWGNKYGLQCGVKYLVRNSESVFVSQMEFNIVRPFTYSHVSPARNYGHYYHSLAHPYGSNFSEVLAKFVYSKKRLKISVLYSNTRYASDSVATNYGNDLYKSYTTRSSDLENSWFQGIESYFHYINLNTSLVVVPKWNLELNLSGIFLKQSDNEKFILSAGLRIPVYNRDYHYPIKQNLY